MRRVVVPTPLKPPRPDVASPVARLSGETMGSTWSLAFTSLTVTPAQARRAVQGALDAVVAQMSPWEPASDLNRYNAAAPDAWVRLPADLATVIDAALDVADGTGGAFDPTLGALIDLWGFGVAPFRGGPPPPDEIAPMIASAATPAGWKRLQRRGDSLLQPGGVKLNLNGIAKGFGVDAAACALEALGVSNLLVEVGGELKGAGARPDGLPWWVERERLPGAPPGPETLVGLSGWSVATSADHLRGFTHESRRFGHTLDPVTGRPRTGATLAATVIHPVCMLADAYATAFLVLDPDRAIELADRLALAVTLLTPRGDVASKAFRDMSD